jgi:hypothetical protein
MAMANPDFGGIVLGAGSLESSSTAKARKVTTKDAITGHNYNEAVDVGTRR